MKELGLTEGRATGIPTIQKHLKLNGNNPAIIETDDDRTYFLMTIPCRDDMVELSNTGAIDQESADLVLKEVVDQLKKELGNDGFQVYVADIVNIDALILQLANLILQVYLQVWEKARIERLELISDVAKVFLTLNREAITSGKLIKRLNVDSLYKLRRYILNPAIAAEYIEMSNPSKPTSSKQKYRLTQMGKSIL